MKKFAFCLTFLGMLFSATACQETSEEKLFSYIEDVANIVIKADNCETAANRIEKYTKDNKENMTRDLKELLDRDEDKAAKEETKEALRAELEKLGDEIAGSKCAKDPKVIGAVTGFTITAGQVIAGTTIGDIGDAILGK